LTLDKGVLVGDLSRPRGDDKSIAILGINAFANLEAFVSGEFGAVESRSSKERLG
jgi:hypothetical protein